MWPILLGYYPYNYDENQYISFQDIRGNYSKFSINFNGTYVLNSPLIFCGVIGPMQLDVVLVFVGLYKQTNETTYLKDEPTKNTLLSNWHKSSDFSFRTSKLIFQ